MARTAARSPPLIGPMIEGAIVAAEEPGRSERAIRLLLSASRSSARAVLAVAEPSPVEGALTVADCQRSRFAEAVRFRGGYPPFWGARPVGTPGCVLFRRFGSLRQSASERWGAGRTGGDASAPKLGPDWSYLVAQSCPCDRI